MSVCNFCEHHFYSFHNSYYNSEEELINLIIGHGVMKRLVTCPNCREEVKIKKKGTSYVFNCRRTKRGVECNFCVSARKNTFLGDSKLSIHKIMFFCLFWLLHPLPRQAVIMDEVKLGSGAVVDWSTYCREVCVHWVVQRRQQIGGLNTVVEIDECKIGRRKHNMGNAVEGHWVFGGIQRGDKSKFFLVPVEQRNGETIIEIIRKWILPGSIIISNNWKAYDTLNNEDFIQLKIKQSLEFVSTGRIGYKHLENLAKLKGLNVSILNNTKENKQKSIKYSIPCFGASREHFEGYFAEYIFKFIHKREYRMHHFLRAAAALYSE